jgi:uncharacterized phage-associated protein
MADVIDVANFILEISRVDSDDGEYELISHMKLQKLVYFCQGFHLALYNEPLFPETIEAWTHGPVCPRLYHILKGYGPSPITTIVDPDKINLSEQEKRIINMVYDNYGQYSASRLRQITHKEGPWNNTWAGSTIPQEAMIEYFNSLIEVKPQNIHFSTDEEKEEIVRAIEEAENNGEITLSQFCIPMGA